MLEELGYTENTKKIISKEGISTSEIARVTAAHKERYVIRTEEGTLKAEITGNMRFSAESSLDLPAVGDWVQIMPMDEDTAVIIKILERTTTLQRRAVGKHGESQLMGANIDYAFLVMACGQDFNLNRLDRYIALCHAGGITPFTLLTKADLISEEELYDNLNQVKQRHGDMAVLSLSIEKEESYQILSESMEKGMTYCFIGSSGAGKSTIINRLSEGELMRTSHVSDSNQKGRHTTTHRELFVISNGSVVIDTPGMREVGLVNDAGAVESTFGSISELAEQCRYSDCSHTNESGCAVLEALENGDLDEREYENYLKLKREEAHYAETVKDKRDKGKQLSKVIRDFKTIKGRNTGL